MISGPYVYNLVGETFHTTDCPSVTAYDALAVLAPRKADVPAGRTHCGHCQRGETA